MKPLRYYLRQLKGDDSPAASALIYFRSLQARGIPVSITKVKK